MVPPPLKIISLGARCEVAWQIRRFYNQPEAYPFDWLVTPFDTLPLIIEEDFEAIADPRHLRVVEYGGGIGWSVLHTRYQLLLHHEFPRDPDGRIVPEWHDHVEKLAAKFSHLRQRWQGLMDGSAQIVFMRRLGCMEMPSEQPRPTVNADYLRLFSVISHRAPRARVSYLFCDCPEVPMAENVHSVPLGYATATDWPRPEDRWKGRTDTYAAIFRDVLTPSIIDAQEHRKFG